MTVKLDHELLTQAASRAETLASAIRTNAASARSASPVALPSLQDIEQKATFLEERAEELYGMADLAMLLDASGQVDLPLTQIRDTLGELLGSYLTAEFGNNFGFGDDDDFPLISVVTGLLKANAMSKGVAPVFQTGLVGRVVLERMLTQGGRAAQWAEWMLAGGAKHQGLPAALRAAPDFVGPNTRLPTGGWADPLARGGLLRGGLAVTRTLGVAGGVLSTAAGVANLYQQGNPVEAFQREGAGYVADVAETAFSASTTAFLVAPNPVTGAIAVGSGLVWAGAEIVDNWDDISDRASDAWDTVTFWD